MCGGQFGLSQKSIKAYFLGLSLDEHSTQYGNHYPMKNERIQSINESGLNSYEKLRLFIFIIWGKYPNQRLHIAHFSYQNTLTYSINMMNSIFQKYVNMMNQATNNDDKCKKINIFVQSESPLELIISEDKRWNE